MKYSSSSSPSTSSALSNEANIRDVSDAWIVFGVTDKSRTVVGTSFRNSVQALQELKHTIAENATGGHSFRDILDLTIEGKRVLLFRIPAAPRGIPIAWKGHYYGRNGESLSALDISKIEEIRRETTTYDWSMEIVPDANIDDLDPDAIKTARLGYGEHESRFAKELERWDDATFLDKARLTIHGKITRAALLLLGKPEASHFLGHIAEIVWKLESEDNVGQVFTIPFLLTTTEVLHRIRNYPFKIFPDNSLLPTEGMKYNSESILEALHNCIAHQDYTRNARIIVIERDNELEFRNRGGFFEGSYEDYIEGKKTPEQYRNPFLAKAMANIRMIDTEGFGIHKLYINQKKRYLPMPDYDRSTPDSVVLTLPGNVIDENYSLMLMKRDDLTLADVVLLDQVQKGKKIEDSAIRMLKKRKLIEGRKPHLYVSKQIAQATDMKVIYSKHKGLDDRKCETFLLDSLRDHGSLTKQEITDLLFDMLPDQLDETQKINKIEYLLKKMKARGQIVNQTHGRASVWLYVKS